MKKKKRVYNPTICLHAAHSGVVKRRMEHSLAKYGGKTMVFWSQYWIFISHQIRIQRPK